MLETWKIYSRLQYNEVKITINKFQMWKKHYAWKPYEKYNQTEKHDQQNEWKKQNKKNIQYLVWLTNLYGMNCKNYYSTFTFGPPNCEYLVTSLMSWLGFNLIFLVFNPFYNSIS